MEKKSKFVAPKTIYVINDNAYDPFQTSPNYYDSEESLLESFEDENFPLNVNVYELKQKNIAVNIERKLVFQNNKGE
jgi:hypothetical protein